MLLSPRVEERRINKSETTLRHYVSTVQPIEHRYDVDNQLFFSEGMEVVHNNNNLQTGTKLFYTPFNARQNTRAIDPTMNEICLTGLRGQEGNRQPGRSFFRRHVPGSFHRLHNEENDRIKSAVSVHQPLQPAHHQDYLSQQHYELPRLATRPLQEIRT